MNANLIKLGFYPKQNVEISTSHRMKNLKFGVNYLEKEKLVVGCGGCGNISILNKALEFIKNMTPEEWQEYEKSLNLEPLDMSKYEDDSGFEIVDFSNKDQIYE